MKETSIFLFDIVKEYTQSNKIAILWLTLYYNLDTVSMTREKEANNINRIKVVLADKMRTNKWLAEELGVAPTTVSKWCTNGSQPPLETLVKIAKLLKCEIQDLVRME